MKTQTKTNHSHLFNIGGDGFLIGVSENLFFTGQGCLHGCGKNHTQVPCSGSIHKMKGG